MFPLSLEEIIERRKMIAQVRAQESYRMAKAARQNKIKSKKY
jgi:U3 small nucleolar RNA-associated protein 14